MFIDFGYGLMIDVHLESESWKYIEHLRIVNMSVYFLAQVVGGRTMGDEVKKAVEVIGDIEVPISLICCEMFPVAEWSH